MTTAHSIAYALGASSVAGSPSFPGLVIGERVIANSNFNSTTADRVALDLRSERCKISAR